MSNAIAATPSLTKSKEHSNKSPSARIYRVCKQVAYLLKNEVSLGAKFMAAAISLFSLSTAHYVGLLSGIPKDAIAWVGTQFAASFIGTFLLYASVSYLTVSVMITVLANSIHLLVLSINTLANRLPFVKVSPMKSAREHISYHRYQALAVTAAKVGLTLVLFIKLYIDSSAYNWSAALLVFILIAGSILTPYGVGLSAFRSFHKLRSKGRLHYKKKALVTAFGGVVASLVVLSYFTGAKRLSYLESRPAIEHKSASYTGTIQVLLQEGESVFGIAESGGVKHYVLASKGTQVVFPISREH